MSRIWRTYLYAGDESLMNRWESMTFFSKFKPFKLWTFWWVTRGKGFETMTMSNTGEGMGGGRISGHSFCIAPNRFYRKNIDMIICLFSKIITKLGRIDLLDIISLFGYLNLKGGSQLRISGWLFPGGKGGGYWTRKWRGCAGLRFRRFHLNKWHEILELINKRPTPAKKLAKIFIACTWF